MRVGRDVLRKFRRTPGPPPAPIEPVLPPAEEAELIAGGDGKDPVVRARRARVLTLLRRQAPPQGADAELVALLAAADALPFERKSDRLSARVRLVEIGRLTNPPPAVVALFEDHRLTPGDGEAFAEELLPSTHDGTHPFHEGASGATAAGG